MSSAEEKQCRSCKEWQTSYSFSKDKKSRDGLNTKCKKCEREYRRNLKLRKNKNYRKTSLALSKQASLKLCSLLELYYSIEENKEKAEEIFLEDFTRTWLSLARSE